MRVLRDIALLLGRVAFGVLMIVHGLRRYFVVGMDSRIASLQALGLPQPALLAYGAVVLDIVGGFLLVIGWLTPLVAAAFATGFVLMIMWTKDYQAGAWLTSIAACLILMGSGAGRASVDGAVSAARRRRTSNGDDFAS